MEATEKQSDNPNMVSIIVVGAAGSLLVLILFIALQAYYSAGSSALQAVRDAEGIDIDYRNVQVEQETLLSTPRWVDQNRRIAAFRIESAMERVVAEAAADRAATLVPAVGAHDTATVPAIPGRPDDNAQVPAAPAQPAAPAEGEAPAEGATEGAAPAEGATEGEAPADQATPPAPAASAAEGNAQQ